MTCMSYNSKTYYIAQVIIQVGPNRVVVLIER